MMAKKSIVRQCIPELLQCTNAHQSVGRCAGKVHL